MESLNKCKKPNFKTNIHSFPGAFFLKVSAALFFFKYKSHPNHRKYMIIFHVDPLLNSMKNWNLHWA